MKQFSSHEINIRVGRCLSQAFLNSLCYNFALGCYLLRHFKWCKTILGEGREYSTDCSYIALKCLSETFTHPPFLPHRILILLLVMILGYNNFLEYQSWMINILSPWTVSLFNKNALLVVVFI